MQKTTKIVLMILVMFLLLVIFIRVLHPFNPNQNGNNSGQNNQTGVTPVLSNGWILPELNKDNYVWGLADGIAFGVQKDSKPPQMDNAPGGTWAPGLIYVMFTDKKGKTYFFNYLAFSIIGKNGFDQSEPEKVVFTPVSTKVEGNILTVVFETSNFENNQIPLNVALKIDKNKPKEIEISTSNPLQDSRPVNYVHVSAAAGSLGRIRNLYLGDEVVNSKDLYAGEQPGSGCFYAIKLFDLNKLKTDSSGVIVYAGNDEPGWVGEWGSAIAPYYNKPKFYQYWRKYSGSYNPDLMFTVNGRDRYFTGFANQCGGEEIRGGVTYENFDMLEKYYDDQRFWFGYSYDLNA